MSHVFNLRLGTLLLAAAVGSGVGTSCGRLTGLHDGCITTADCDPGRHCVAGTCQSGTNQDASIDRDGDAVTDGAADELDAAQEKAGNIDARDTGDANGGPGDAHDASEVGDTDGGDGVDAPSDTSGDAKKAPSPCFLPTDSPAAPTSAALPQSLSGTWQLCTDPANLAPDIHWMLGDAGTIQLDGVNWWRLAMGQVDHGDATFAGAYFRLLEGTHSAFEFVDADLNAAGGATLAVGLFPATAVLELTSCDGAGTCDGPVARLVNVAGGSGQ